MAINDELDTILAHVEAQATVEESIKAMVIGLVQSAGVDPAKVAAIQTALNANDTKLAEALLAGTPSAPPAP